MQKVNLSQPIWKKVLFVILATVAVVCAVTAAVLPLSKGDLANADSQTVECLVMGNESPSNTAVAYFYSDHHFANGTLTDDDRAPKIAVGSGSSAEYQLFNNTLHEDMFEDMWYEFRPCTATHEQWEANWSEYPAASTQYSSYFKEGVTHDFRSDSTHRAIPYDDVYHLSKCRMCDQTMLIAHNLNENGVCEDCHWQADLSEIYYNDELFAIFYNDYQFREMLEFQFYGDEIADPDAFAIRDYNPLKYDVTLDNPYYTLVTDGQQVHMYLGGEGDGRTPIHDFRVWDSSQIVEDPLDDPESHLVKCASCDLVMRIPCRRNSNYECYDCDIPFQGNNSKNNVIISTSSTDGRDHVWGVFDKWDRGDFRPYLYDSIEDIATSADTELYPLSNPTFYTHLFVLQNSGYPGLAMGKYAPNYELNNSWFVDAYGAVPNETHDFRVKEPNSAIYLTSSYHLVECSMCGLQVAVGHTFDGSGKCIYCDNDCSEHIYYMDGGVKKVWGLYSVDDNRTTITSSATHLTPKQPNGTLTLGSEQSTHFYGNSADNGSYGVMGDGWLATNYPSPVEHPDREPLGLPYTDEYTHDFRVKPGQATCVDLQYHTVKCSCGETIQVEHRLNSDGICIDCNEKPHESEQVTRSWTFTLDDAVQFTAQGDGTVTATINVSATGIVLGEGDVLALYVKSGNATDDEKFRILLTDGIAIGYTVSCNSVDHGKTADNTYDNDKGLLLWQLTWGSGQDPLNEYFTVTLTLNAPAQFAGEWKDSLTFTAVLVEA